MQAHLLFKVEDVFAIQGRGLILVPGAPKDMLVPTHPHLLTLKYADGSSRKVIAVFFLPMLDPGPHQESGYLCELKGADEADVPIGTEVWIEE